MMLKQATFAAGCFWGVEAAFQNVAGVIKTTVGYCGGHKENPTYREVCAGNTGHAESVRIDYDPEQVSYQQLLTIFWQCHNPTTLNRQGVDIGSQYRSIIFFHDPEQQQWAEQSKQAEASHYATPIVTEILPEQIFYKAEEYHQQYCTKHGK